jgi:hypothetical protein
MKRYFIEEAKCGVSEGGMACGPMSGSVVAAVKYKENENESKWIYLVEVDGITNYFLTDEDVFDMLIKEDDETIERMNECAIREFDGVSLGEGDYDFYSLQENEGNPAVPLIRYIIALVRCEMEEIDALVALANGKYIDELEIPLSDLEEEYLEDMAEEEGEEQE